MTKPETTTRMSLAEIRAKKGETDWERLRAEEAAGIEPAPDADEPEVDFDKARLVSPLVVEEQPQVSEENPAKTTSIAEGENTLALEAQSEALPPVAEGADSLPAVSSGEEIADPVTLPDAQLLQALITAIMARNTDQHRPALWVELERAGAAVTDGSLVLACIRGVGTGTQQSMLANWCNAARRHLMEVGHV